MKKRLTVYILIMLVCAAGAFFCGCGGNGEYPKEYNVAALECENGIIVLSESGQISEGSSVTVTLVPDAGYRADALFVNGESVGFDADGVYIIRSLDGDKTFSASFSEIKYNYSVSVQGNGTAEFGEKSGGKVSFYVRPEEHFFISSILLDGSAIVLEDGAEYKGQADAFADHALAVVFSPIKYKIEIDDPLGVVTSDKSEAVFGEKVELFIALPADGRLMSLTLNGAEIKEDVSSGRYVFTADGDVLIKAEVDCRTYSVGVVTDESVASFELSGNVTYEGGSVILTVLPAKGYRITALSANGKLQIFNGREFVLKNVCEDTILSVTGEKIRYEVTVSSGEGGTVGASRDTFYYGDDVTLYFQPDTGYKLTGLIVCGEKVEASGLSYVVSGKAENITVEAEFGKEIYTVITAKGAGGSISADKTRYSVGDRVNILITPDAGYRAKSVSVNGTEYKNPGNVFTLPEFITGDVTVYAEFEKIVYSLSLTVSGGGRAECGTTRFTVDDEISVALFPDEGCDAQITVNGTETECLDNRLVLKGQTRNLDIVVTFVRREYAVTVSYSGGGTAKTVPSGNVKHGDSVIVVLSPDSGCHTEKIIVNGNVYTADGDTFTLNNITGNISVEVKFAPDMYSVILEKSEGGTLTADKSRFTLGETVTVEFIPDSGYRLESVTVNGMFMTSQVDGNKLSVEGGAADMTVKAVFADCSQKFFNCSSDLEEKYGSVVFASQSVTEGGNAAFMVKMAEGYKVETVSCGGKSLVPDKGIYTVSDVRSDIVVHVGYSPIVYTVTIEKSDKAAVEAPATYTVEDEVTFIVTDLPGYRAESINVGEKTLLLSGGKAVYRGTGDITVSVNSVFGRYEVTATESEEFEISLDKAFGGIGETVTVSASAAPGYKITGIILNGIYHAFGGGEYLLKDITAETVVSVKTDFVYYSVTVKNYFNGIETVDCGELKPDKYSYTVKDTVVFSIIGTSGYYMRSVTINGENYTDRVENGKINYSGRHNLIVVANFAENGITLKGTVKEPGGNAVEGAKITVDGLPGTEFTTDSSGKFSAVLENGRYALSCSANGYMYGETRTVSGENSVVEVTLIVANSVFDSAESATGADFSYDFAENTENVTVTGKTPSMAFVQKNGGDFAAVFTAENLNDASTDYEKEPGIGIEIKCGGNTFVCQFVAKRARIIINNDWSKVVSCENSDLYDFNAIGEKHDLAFLKNGNTVIFLAKGKTGEYEKVFSYSDDRLSGICAYSFYVTKLNATKTLKMKFTGFATAETLKNVPVGLKGGITTEKCEGGALIPESYDDGFVFGKPYRVYAMPDYGMQLTEIYVNGEPCEFIGDGAGGGYITVEANGNPRITAEFVPYGSGKISFSDGTGYGNCDYDKTLFYKNDLITDGADPGVMYVSEEEDPINGGWFYMTVTSHCSYEKVWGGDGVYYRAGAFLCYRSKDLASWERVGAIDGYALGVRPEEWAYDCFWAPEMMRDSETGKYFLYFSARSKVGNGNNYSASRATSINGSGEWDRLYLGIAMADSPMGPYRLVSALDYNDARGIKNKNTNADGTVINGEIVPVNFAKNLIAVKNKKYDFWPAIDVSPFRDENGDFYLYFSQHVSSVSYGNSIWMMKMKDLITPDYSTMRLVSIPGYTDVTSEGKGESIYFNKCNVNYSASYGFTRYSYDGNAYGNGVNEGVNVIKDPESKKYFLTYSPFGYGSRRYSVMQAVSDNPSGPFTKLAAGIANPVLGIYNKNDSPDYSMSTDLSASIDYIAGTGHHCFVKAGDELFAVYHAFYNPVNNNRANGSFMGRRIAADRVYFTYNETVGHNVLYGNGPTDTLQAMPSASSGYGNVISSASVTATNASGDSVKYLSDGLFVLHNGYENREFTASGSSIIEVTFPVARKIRAVMIYSAARYKYALKRAGEIKLITSDGKELIFTDVELNSGCFNADRKTMHYGGAIIADFDAVEVKKIIISVDKRDKLDAGNDILKISDIVVLGETDSVKAADKAAYASSGGVPANDSVRVDGKPFDSAWTEAASYISEYGGTKYEVKAVRGENGVYFLATAYVNEVYHSAENGDTYIYSGLRRFYKNSGWRLKLFVGAGAYNAGSALSVTADAYSFVIDNGKTGNVAMYVEGTVNAVSESFSIEVYVPYTAGSAYDNPNVLASVQYYKVSSATAVSGSAVNVCRESSGIINFRI